MTQQQQHARLHRSSRYDGTNGAAVVADIPGASLTSGGTGNTTLVIDISGAGQYSVPPNRNIVWTEYPSTPVNVLDSNLSDSDLALVYALMVSGSSVNTMLTNWNNSGLSGLKVQRATGATDANGNVTLTWASAFSVSPVIAVGLETSTNELHSHRITARSASATTIHVERAPTVTVLSIVVLAATVNASGVTVHALAVGPA